MQRKTSKVAPSKGFPQKKLAKKLWHSLKSCFFFLHDFCFESLQWIQYI